MPGPLYSRPVSFVNGTAPFRNATNLNAMQDGVAQYAEDLIGVATTGTASTPGGSQALVANTSTQVAAAKSDRRELGISNPGTEPVWLLRGTGTAVVGSGQIVWPGGTEVVERYYGVVKAICSVAVTLGIYEF